MSQASVSFPEERIALLATKAAVRYNANRPQCPYEIAGIHLTETELVATLLVLREENAVPTRE